MPKEDKTMKNAIDPALLRERMKELGLSSRALGVALGPPPKNVRTVQRWRSGETPIPSLVWRAVLAMKGKRS